MTARGPLPDAWVETFADLSKRLEDARRLLSRKGADLARAERGLRDIQVRCDRLERDKAELTAALRSLSTAGQGARR